jgi:CheY-like chemotaxis protein
MASAKKVLLVDDDPDFIEINRIALESKGYTILAAADGDEGLATAKAERPDAIVLDVMMSTPTEGFEVARQLRADPDLARIPLIMLTSVNREGLPWRYEPDSEWLPVDVFLDKPVPADRLIATVEKALSGE